MRLELDSEARALYFRLRPGRVAETVELAETVFMDVDRDNEPLGIEFLDPDTFASYIEQHQEVATIPSHLTVQSLDRQKEWEVEVTAGASVHDTTHASENARRLAQFALDLFQDPATIDAIPDKALVVLAPRDRPVVLHPLNTPATAGV